MLVLALAVSMVAGISGAQASAHQQGPPPSGCLALTGDTGSTTPVDDPVHDPAIFKDPSTQTYYVASTGILQSPEDPGGIYLRRSVGSLVGPWESLGALPVPEWALEYDSNHLWAPDIVRTGDTFWMYYAVSQLGTQNSAIGVMSTTTPADLASWQDHGPVFTSEPGDPYNAIDPQVLKDRGTWYLAFGSWWEGIHLVELTDMTSVTGEPVQLAEVTGAPSLEAPTIVVRQGSYYLFTSRGFIVSDSYHVQVGRSTSLTGPYVDRDGVPLLEGGGTVVLETEGGAGGQDVIKDRGRYYMVNHVYEWEPDLQIRLQICELQWDEGWPQIPEDDGPTTPGRKGPR
ncbi:arabinan endo-1,5-alpha-L-arabinosidase [Actinotalea sp. BY-33]|uniref:Arabinan endo-1,5-alpha-L-arabinosidase n=1 Tax=Actinotalea soli TaxID=2819234 RepID=A0A939RU29_9CELL|nr:arabinan endo-1,5-alpha-L-arabinosidase [Actinotalea soli]MBO1752124.1 arabinan endo-1,5-alpha-L-arabinosidase [Actinotalea soli]